MNTVKKGTGRPAAAAKRRTHAQKTPLPPRKGSVSAAKEAIGDAQKVAGGTRGTRKPQKPGASTTTTALATTKSAAKAKVYAAKVVEVGWAAKIAHHGETTEVTATRGGEELWISWTSGSMVQHPMPRYSAGGRSVTMRNASECLKYAARSEAEASAAVPKGRTVGRPKAERRATSVRLPFDPAAATDEEVVSALVEAQVIWRNSLSDLEEKAWLPASSKDIEVKENDGGDRTISFCCRSGMYRAFRLSSLISVSGGMYRPRKSPKRKK